MPDEALLGKKTALMICCWAGHGSAVLRAAWMDLAAVNPGTAPPPGERCSETDNAMLAQPQVAAFSRAALFKPYRAGGWWGA